MGREAEGLVMEIETKSASLDTLSVTIRALHVNGKQMTLAVFRQLPCLSLYLETGDINNDLRHWGIVRYFIKDEGSEWVVADYNGVLYRCDLYPDNATDERLLYICRQIEEIKAEQKSAQNSGRYVFVDKIQLSKYEETADIWEKILKSRQVLLKLPQLFIAV
jgi:hypothetical protein